MSLCYSRTADEVASDTLSSYSRKTSIPRKRIATHALALRMYVAVPHTHLLVHTHSASFFSPSLLNSPGGSWVNVESNIEEVCWLWVLMNVKVARACEVAIRNLRICLHLLSRVRCHAAACLRKPQPECYCFITITIIPFTTCLMVVSPPPLVWAGMPALAST